MLNPPCAAARMMESSLAADSATLARPRMSGLRMCVDEAEAFGTSGVLPSKMAMDPLSCAPASEMRASARCNWTAAADWFLTVFASAAHVVAS